MKELHELFESFKTVEISEDGIHAEADRILEIYNNTVKDILSIDKSTFHQKSKVIMSEIESLGMKDVHKKNQHLLLGIVSTLGTRLSSKLNELKS